MASSPAPPGVSQSVLPTFGMPTQAPGDEPAPARLMQIKVLYTFDNEKSTCLARCSQPVYVHTLQLEDNTEIGVVELRTCIRAILAASPELVAPKTNSDYTIYAYDYSEYETPLVGQGMLSWALASTSATPTAPAEQSLTPVTGRVTRNVRSLFPNSGPPEILQVKLKLVPVPKAMENEYAEGMEKYRDPNNYSSQGFDPAAWNAFLQTRQTFPSPAPSPAPSQSAAGYPPSLTQHNPTTLYAPAPQSSRPSQPPQFVFQANTAAASTAPSKAGSRPGTPRARRASVQSRPSSRASNRGGLKPQRVAPLQRVDSAPAAVPTLEASDPDNSQARKRARVQQANWRGPSAFDNAHEPLRVAASAAASIRGHRPSIPGHPTAADFAAAEPGLRPPTPRPAGSRLSRNDSSMSTSQPSRRWYQSPYAMSTDGVEGPDSEAGTPMDDGGSAGSTPADIPSSPPVIHRASIEPSSPPLPRLTNVHQDSGFVSGTMDESMMDDGAGPSKLSAPPIMSEMPSSEETIQHDHSVQNRPQRPATAPKQPSGYRRTGSFAASSPRLPPLIPSRMDATSPAPMMLPPTESAEPEAAHGHQGAVKLSSGAKRYRSIQTRMEEDIAAGKLPPFCKNCGEIDTPTWRKCFVKTVQGIPDAATIAAEHGDALITFEVTEKSDDGMTQAYRVIKKSVVKEEAELFEQLKLCNSCGMWLFKTKTMRPPDKWQKQPPKVDKNGNPTARKRPSRAKSGSVPAEIKTDVANMDVDEAMLWSALTTEGVQAENNEWALTDVSGRSDKSQPKSTCKRARVSSAAEILERGSTDPFQADKQAMVAYQRAVHSSPPKFPGSKGSPIDLSKETPEKGVRRLLFPSPRKQGETKTLDGSQDTGTPSKSNGASVVHIKDPFADTFIDQENAASGQFTTPKGKKSRVDLLRTPTRSSPRLAARKQAASDAPVGPTTPSRAAAQHVTPAEMTPFTSQLNALMSDGIAGTGNYSFGDAADPSGMFAFSDFAGMDDFGLEGIGLPQSDGDFFPVFDDKDFSAEIWNGGPLLEGELEELLKEAGDDAFLDKATPANATPAAALVDGDGAVDGGLGASGANNIGDGAAVAGSEQHGSDVVMHM